MNRFLSDFNFTFIQQKVVSAVKKTRNKTEDLRPWLAAGKGDRETFAKLSKNQYQHCETQ